MTGDGSGTTQQFIAPAGAVALYLGISDACSYNGAPSCYNDNSPTTDTTHNFLVTYNGAALSATPLPAALPMFVSGLADLGGIYWGRKRKKRV